MAELKVGRDIKYMYDLLENAVLSKTDSTMLNNGFMLALRSDKGRLYFNVCAPESAAAKAWTSVNGSESMRKTLSNYGAIMYIDPAATTGILYQESLSALIDMDISGIKDDLNVPQAFKLNRDYLNKIMVAGKCSLGANSVHCCGMGMIQVESDKNNAIPITSPKDGSNGSTLQWVIGYKADNPSGSSLGFAGRSDITQSQKDFAIETRNRYINIHQWFYNILLGKNETRTPVYKLQILHGNNDVTAKSNVVLSMLNAPSYKMVKGKRYLNTYQTIKLKLTMDGIPQANTPISVNVANFNLAGKGVVLFVNGLTTPLPASGIANTDKNGVLTLHVVNGSDKAVLIPYTKLSALNTFSYKKKTIQNLNATTTFTLNFNQLKAHVTNVFYKDIEAGKLKMDTMPIIEMVQLLCSAIYNRWKYSVESTVIIDNIEDPSKFTLKIPIPLRYPLMQAFSALPYSLDLLRNKSAINAVAAALTFCVDTDLAVRCTMLVLKAKMCAGFSSKKEVEMSKTLNNTLLRANVAPYNSLYYLHAFGGYLGYGTDVVTKCTTEVYRARAAAYLKYYYAGHNPSTGAFEVKGINVNDLLYVSDKNGSPINVQSYGMANLTDSKTETALKYQGETIKEGLKRFEFSLDDLKFTASAINVTDDKLNAEIAAAYANLFANIKYNVAGIIGLPPRFPDLADPRFDDTGDGKPDIYGPAYGKYYLTQGHIVTLSPGKPKFAPDLSEADKNAIKLAAASESGAANSANTDTSQVIVSDALNQRIKSDIKEAKSNVDKNAGGTLFSWEPDWVEYTAVVARLIFYTAQLFHISNKDLIEMLDVNEVAALTGITKDGANYLASPKIDDITETTNNLAYDLDMNPNMIETAVNNMLAGNDANNKNINGVKMYNTYIYNNGPLTITENVSNTVGASFAQQMLGMQANEAMKDLSFLLGTPLGNDMSNLIKDMSNSKILSAITSGDGALATISSKLFGVSSQVAKVAGANMKIPEVFKDSNYTKSYEIKIKLCSPDGSVKSFFKNIMLEWCRLAPYFLPRQFGAFIDAQMSPFLLQVYSKGLIACELALVTGADFSRNPETMSLNRLPTEIDVTLQIKDLSPILSIPYDKNDIGTAPDRKFIAAGIIPYIATYAGIPLYRSDNLSFFNRKFQGIRNIINSAVSTPGKAIHQGYDKYYNSILGKITGKK